MIETAAPRQAPAQHEPETPYVGLVPYRDQDADFFFGRDQETQVVSGNLRASRLTIIYGASGVGKSSLLEAGVVHQLHGEVLANVRTGRERAPFAICSFRAWRDEPLPALAETIRASVAEALGGEETPAWQPEQPFGETLRAWTERARTLLVILDQFEDYFLYHPDDDGEGTFAVEFPRIVNDHNLRVHVLISIREDAWARLDRFKGRIPRLFANYVRIAHLNRKAAREAIEGPIGEWNRRLPAGAAPYSVEPALVEAIIDATGTRRLTLGGDGNGAGPDITDAEAIEAPFLQLALERIWRATTAAGSRAMTLARLDELGGAERIVENHLHEAMLALTPSDQAVAAEAFRYLVTRSRTKIAYSASDVADLTARDEAEVADVLEKLCRGESGRILRHVPPPGDGAMRYELFHDVLAEPVLEWRRAYEEDRERRARIRRRARRGGLSVGLVLLAAFLVLGGWAFKQRGDAQAAQRSASSLALAFAARGQLPSRVDTALLLGLDAYLAKPGVQAESSMISALEWAQRSGAEALLHGTDADNRVAFSPDQKTLATAGADKTIRLWNVKTGEQLGQPLAGHTDAVSSLAFSPDGYRLASGSFDETVRLWDVRSDKPIGSPLKPREKSTIYAVAFSPDGKMLASADAKGAVRFWNGTTGKELGAPLEADKGEVYAVAFSPDGNLLASAGAHGVRLWSVRTQAQDGKPLGRGSGRAFSIAFSPDGRLLVGGYQGIVRLWAARTRRQVGTMDSPGASVSFSPDGDTLATGGFDGPIRLWSVLTRRQTDQPRLERVGSLAFSADGQALAIAGGGAVRLWNLVAHEQLGDALGPGRSGPVHSIAFSPDGTMVAAGSDKGDSDTNLRLWNLSDATPAGRSLAGHTGTVSSNAFSPDGETLASAGADGTVRFWNVNTGTQIGAPLGSPPEPVYGVVFSPDGQTVASTADTRVRFWDSVTREELKPPVRGPAGFASSIALSPDGSTLATSGYDGTVRLWDVGNRKQLGQPIPARAASLTFSPDGRTLATGGYDTTVRLWNVRTHNQIGQPLRGHAGTVSALAFRPDGPTLATAGDDATVRLWDVRTHQQLGRPLRGHNGPVLSVAFSPDGTALASGGFDGTVRIWRDILWTDAADLRKRVCALVWGNLTRSEWAQYVPGLPYRTTCPR